MSMDIHPATGYVVGAEDYLKAVGAAGQEIEALDTVEDYLELARKKVKAGKLVVPLPDDAFCLSDEDISDSLLIGAWYFAFDESDLYTRQPTPAHVNLTLLGIHPAEETWGIWG